MCHAAGFFMMSQRALTNASLLALPGLKIQMELGMIRHPKAAFILSWHKYIYFALSSSQDESDSDSFPLSLLPTDFSFRSDYSSIKRKKTF